jgi:pre-mRNA-splicing factor ATP-dependent RNA helicase DHX16
MVDQLREISRQHYLEKREEKELKLLELTLRDEKDLFDHEELTYEERNRYEINKKILEFSKDKNRFNYKDDSYKLPDSYEDGDGRIDKKKKEAVLTNRYIEEIQVKSEQELWEESQMKTSKVKYVFEVLVLVVCMVDVKYIFLAYS